MNTNASHRLSGLVEGFGSFGYAIEQAFINDLSRILSIFRELSKLAWIEGIKVIGCIGTVRRNATFESKNISNDEEIPASAGSGFPEEA
jgi:hypothetical protein